ncbi:MAG: hypothetical protein WD749_01125 [Phycisphaerales bacterium]
MTTRPAEPKRPLFPRLAALACTTIALAGAPLAAQEAKPAADEGFRGGTVFVIERGSLDTLAVDPKDKALAAAIAMIPQRLGELPREIPDMPPEAAAMLSTLVKTIARPMRVTVAYDETPSGGAFGYGVAFSVLTAGKPEADALHTQLNDALDQAQGAPSAKPSTRIEGMLDMQTPIGLLSFGPREGSDGWRYEIIFGTMADPDAGAAALPAPAGGLKPFLRGRLDFAGLTPALNMAQMLAGATPEFQEGRKQMESLGVVGRNAMKMGFQAGYSETALVVHAALQGAGTFADTLGLPRQPLNRADLAAIPSDAIYASLSRSGGSWLAKAIENGKAQSEEFAEGLAQFVEMTGVDPEADILGALGDVSGFYMSDSTGGGGLGSSVLMFAVKDRAKLLGSFTKLAGLVNEQAEMHANGYIRIAVVPSRGAADMITLQFPGIPVPLELTMALTDSWLLLSPTPQGAMVAANQARGQGDGGLPSNPAFASAMPKDAAATSISFSDTARHLPLGYTLVSMAGSAIANGVRSPSDESRSPGLLVPTYPDLKRGARASVLFSYWKGDDYIFESHGDRSLLVNATSAVGSLSRFVSMFTIPAAIGAIQGAQEAARGRAEAAPRVLPGDPAPAGMALLDLYRHSLPGAAADRIVLEAMSAAPRLWRAEAAEPALP